MRLNGDENCPSLPRKEAATRAVPTNQTEAQLGNVVYHVITACTFDPIGNTRHSPLGVEVGAVGSSKARPNADLHFRRGFYVAWYKVMPSSYISVGKRAEVSLTSSRCNWFARRSIHCNARS
jgi:hypothetical protein